MAEVRQAPMPVLQKMEIADIIDAAIRLYRHNFLPLLEIVAIAYVAVIALQLVLSYQLNSLLMTESEEIPWGALLDLLPFALLFMAVSIMLFPLCEGALAFAVSEIYLGRRTSLGSAYRRVWPMFWRLLLTMLLVGIAILVGSLFCLIPGMVLWIWFFVTTPVVALEGSWGAAAMRRSYNLVTGHGWRVFATYLLLSLIMGVAVYALTIPVQLGGMAIVAVLGEAYMPIVGVFSGAVSGVVQIVVRPVLMIGTVLIYYDLRIRKEGFDLMMMAQALGAKGPDDSLRPETEEFFPRGIDLPPRPDEETSGPPPRPA